MPTVNDIITDAYGEIGVYGPSDTISAADSSFAMRRLNMILDTWSAQPLMSMALSNQDVALTPGTQTYTLTGRPTRLRAARLSYPNSNPLFYPVQILGVPDYEYLESRRYYNTGPTRPDTIVYQASLPNNQLLVAPVPDQACTLRVWYDYTQPQVAALTDSLTLSPSYYKGLMLQLAMEIAPSFGATINQVTQVAWTDAIRTIKAMNTVLQGTPYDSRMPGMSGRFDIRSGMTY